MNQLEKCRWYNGPEEGFWPLFVETIAAAADCSHVLVLRRSAEGGEAWKPFCAWPAGDRFPLGTSLEDAALAAVFESAIREGIAEFPAPGDPPARMPVVAIDAGVPTQQFLLVFRFADTAPDSADFSSRIARSLDLPLLYRRARELKLANENNRAYTHTFDVLSSLDGQEHFAAAVMSLCNELVRQTRCSRVSLGWREDAYIHVRAISDLLRFDRGMEAVQKLEAAMEEAFDQDEEIILPEPDEASYVARDHHTFAQNQGIEHLASIPLRIDQRAVGVVTLERQGQAFSADEITALRVVLDRAARKLSDLARNEGSLWRRFARFTRAKVAKLLGPEHTWWKLLGVATAAILLVMIFGTWRYRVEGKFLVRSETLVNVATPFDGYLTEVPVRVGDRVSAGDVLIRLDKRELLLEQNSLVAEIARYEAARAQAEVERRLADMSSAAAAKEQTQASLDIVRFRLARADIAAASDGVVIEGDLRERIGMPVKSGDLLMRLSRIDQMYVEIEVSEADAHAVLQSRKGEVAFTAMPDPAYPVLVDQLEPVARVKAEGNVFVLRARIAAPADQTWWRPGMSGVAKIDAGRKPIIWLMTHRLVDFLRLKLWI